MPRARIKMVIQEEILRLKGLGRSQREIAAILGINKDTVSKYLILPLAAENDLCPIWASKIDWIYVENELKSKVPRKILYEELKEKLDLPAYSNFCRFLAIHLKKNVTTEITVKINRIPGESVEVDFSGDTWQILNAATGEIIVVELFVGAMSYSNYFYAEFCYTQKLDDWVSAHNRMFRFFGGVPKYIVPDNCKTAVTIPDKYDPELNKTYHDMCIHYSISVDPARVRHPKDKPNVERAIGILQQDFFPRIRNKTFTSLWELNKELHDYIQKKKLAVIKERGKSRWELFQNERPFLRALPEEDYKIFYFKKAKVHPDCHIQHSRNFYSVPYIHVSKEVVVRFNSTMVYIYVDTICVAIHQSLKGHGHYSTVDSHYPEKKVVEIHMSILGIKSQAEKIGPNLLALIERLFKFERFPLKNLRKAQGILALAKNYNPTVIEHAAEAALEHNRLYYSFIKQCAQNYKPVQIETPFRAPKRQLELICLKGELN